MSTYQIRELAVTARPVAGVRARIGRGDVAREFGRHLDLVYAAGKTGQVQLDGQNIFIYGAGPGDDLSVAFCVGASAAFTTAGRVEPMLTPQGVAATTAHIGDYGRLGEAHAAITSWCRANGRHMSGVSWEVYGHWHADPSQLRTDVYYLLDS